MRHFVIAIAVLMCALSACGGEASEAEGRWVTAPRTNESLDQEQRDLIARLEAIGYAQGVFQAAGSAGGMRLVDVERVWPGYALYFSGHAPEALLVDLEGRVLHRWHIAFDEVWPDYPRTIQRDHSRFFFRRGYLYENGDLLVVFEGYGLVKLDRDSRILWSRQNRAHHDIDVLADGRIVTLTRTARVIPRIDPERPKVEDFIVTLDEQGRELERVSILEALERSPWSDEVGAVDTRLPTRFKAKARAGDLFHTNAVEIVREDHPRLPWLRRGHALISLRFLSALAVVDLKQERFVWLHRGEFVGQHDPHLLSGNRMLVFDNGNHVQRSRAVELDLSDGGVLWEYPEEGETDVFSRCCGTVARLPNGNTLLVFTDMGLAQEVTPEGELVWEFASPHRAGEQGELIASLFDVIRLPQEFPLHWASQR